MKKIVFSVAVLTVLLLTTVVMAKSKKNPFQEIWDTIVELQERDLDCVNVKQESDYAKELYVECPEGYKMTGGGCICSYHVLTSTRWENQWYCDCYNYGPMQTTAICCKLA